MFAKESKKEAYRTKENTIAYRKINTVVYILPPAVAAAAATTPLPDTNSSLSRDESRLSPPAIRATHRHELDRAASEREKNKKKFHCRRSVAGVSSFKLSLSLSLSLLSLIIYTFVFNIHFHQRQQQQLYFVHSRRKQDHKFYSFYCRNIQEPASIAVLVAIKLSPPFFSSFIYRSSYIS